MKEVIFFINASVGGAERVTYNIAKCLPRSLYNVRFAVVGSQIKEVGDMISSDYPVDLIKVKHMYDNMTIKIIKYLRHHHPYAVFSSAMHMCPMLIVASKIVGGIKIVLRNFNYISTLRFDHKVLVKSTYFLADYLIAQQDEMKKDILKHIPFVKKDRVVTIQNPIDTELVDKLSREGNPFTINNAVNYLSVARFHQTKGQDILCKAFVNLVKQADINAHLWFVGNYNENDSFFKECRSIIEIGGCTERVHFIGFEKNPYKWMNYSDCFILPSRIEGLPNALIESQYLGCPCVATTCIPVIRRIIHDGVNGYTVPVNDFVSMAEAMYKAPSLGNIKSLYPNSGKNDFIGLF